MTATTTIILCLLLPCLMTTLGALLIFFFTKTSKLVNMLTIGLASGIMLSASIWSLLVPALENSQNLGKLSFLPITVGFVLGALFMLLLDFLSSKLTKFKNNAEKTKAFKLFTAITVHNIPEGLSVGFAVGTAITLGSPLLSSFMFTVGIALQNFPEGLATALPIYNCIKSRPKAFALGFLSGVVEPIFAILGFFLASSAFLLPWLLSFSAGSMIYVIVSELMPELNAESSSYGTWAFVIGFLVMMLMDICL